MWIVVALNVGYGLIGVDRGFLADSRALNADAVDFSGDGMITVLGLLAVGRSLVWWERAALLQNLCLGALGLSVLGNTLYRLVVRGQPEGELMGRFGLVAPVINVAAALILIPHRTGDANVHEVWLFAWNDALGNLIVVIAAGLGVWTRTAWPDLAAAFVIASLFLQSTWPIIRDARGDLAMVAGSARR